MTESAHAHPPEGDRRPGPSRRLVAQGMAWSVPAVALSAAAPAYAASSDIAVAVVSSCISGGSRNGSFTVTADFIALGAELQIVLTHSGSGSFSAVPNFAHTGTGTTYVVTGTGGPFVGQIAVQLTAGQNGTSVVTANVSAPGGATTGDTEAQIRVTRTGNSNNYSCSAL